MDINIICENCNKQFSRRKAEVNRSQRLGRRQYCSRKCQGVVSRENIAGQSGRPENLIPENRRDEYTKFKWYIKVIKQRTKNNFSVDLQYLKNLWEKQKGICPISGQKLILREHNDKISLLSNHASLDRIDNDKGYIKGNVRFVAVIANFARNCFTDEQLIEFCKNVAEHNKVG